MDLLTLQTPVTGFGKQSRLAGLRRGSLFKIPKAQLGIQIMFEDVARAVASQQARARLAGDAEERQSELSCCPHIPERVADRDNAIEARLAIMQSGSVDRGKDDGFAGW